MSDTNVKRLVFAIMKFLHDQRGSFEGETLEQVEVAQQFLESAYGFELENPEAKAQYDVDRGLLDIFNAAVGSQPKASVTPVSPEEAEKNKAKAEENKTRGNELMKQEKFEEALVAYTDAISLNNRNAVYFCNRAAAHSKLGNHEEAVDDCEAALDIDPTYSKAFGRMGLAYSALGRHSEALTKYKRALELDPANESYKNNLKIAEEKSREGPPPANPLAGLANMFGGGGLPGGFPGGLGGGMPPGMPDMTSLLSNPQMMTMATQMMQNPDVQNFMSSLMGGGGGTEETGGAPPNMDNLLRAGQQLAAQLQETNPDLVQSLREQMGQPPADKEGDDGQSG